MSKTPRLVRKTFQNKLFLLPGLLTVSALFFGFMSLISSSRAEFSNASLFILIAMIFDGLDGRVARRLKATSEFGKEFDSLSDVISFGVAPGFLLYCWSFMHWMPEFGAVVCFLYVVCCASRLARFNVNVGKEKSGPGFTGLPSPGAAAAVASTVFLFPDTMPAYPIGVLVMIYTVLVAALMVSSVPFFKLNKIQLSENHSPLMIMLLAVAVAIAWKFSRPVVFAGSLVYVLSGLVLLVNSRRSGDLEQDSGEESSSLH